MVRFATDSPRVVDGRMMILEDSAFNLWADNKREKMQLRLMVSRRNMRGMEGTAGRDPIHEILRSCMDDCRAAIDILLNILNKNARLNTVDCKVV